MTNVRDPVSLSAVELVVLARLSTTKSTSEKDLREAVAELAAKDASERPALEAFEALRGRGLAARSPRGSRRRTDEGSRALRAALGLAKAPTWREVRTTHLPALGLAAISGGGPPPTSLASTEAVACAVLRAHFGTPAAATVAALCDALIAEKLGMPAPAAPLTLGTIRAFVLAQRTGAKPLGTPEDVALRVAFDKLGVTPPATRRAYRSALTRALALRRLGGPAQGRAGTADTATTTGVRPLPRGADPAPPPETSPPLPRGADPAPPPPAPEALLQLVRDAIPHVGADGRFGSEKVFVSAIWRNLERERRVPELSLDRFKQWLLRANREGKLVLARADMISAMDARLVAESVIEDQGVTFHFVLDRRPASTAGRLAHAR